MKVINLFGCPGSGKSTTAAMLYFKLSSMGYKVELVSESTLDLIKNDQKIITQDNIFNVQKKKFNIDADYIITDSPLLLSVIYDTRKNPDFNDKVLYEFLEYDNINVLLNRTVPYWNLSNDAKYFPENDPLYIALKELLDFYNLDYIEIVGDDLAADEIIEYLDEI